MAHTRVTVSDPPNALGEYSNNVKGRRVPQAVENLCFFCVSSSCFEAFRDTSVPSSSRLALLDGSGRAPPGGPELPMRTAGLPGRIQGPCSRLASGPRPLEAFVEMKSPTGIPEQPCVSTETAMEWTRLRLALPNESCKAARPRPLAPQQAPPADPSLRIFIFALRWRQQRPSNWEALAASQTHRHKSNLLDLLGKCKSCYSAN